MATDARRVVIYHANCWDGAAAAWACLQHPAWKSAEFIPAQYRDPAPDVAGADVAVLDFSYARDELVAMHAAARSLVGIDHHETAEQNLRGLDFCRFDKTRSGAGLAWRWLFGAAPASSVPLILRYIEDADLYRFRLTASRLVKEYVETFPREPKSVDRLHRECLRVGIQALAERGQAIARRSEVMVTEARQHARDFVIADVPGRIANLPVASLVSPTCSALAVQGSGWGGAWALTNEGVAVSLRSVQGDPNVARIAERFGGGGHPGAAGFTIPLPRFLSALEAGRLDP